LLVHQGIIRQQVVFRIERWVSEEAKRTQPVVDRDNDDLAACASGVES
jgi:hypothetical protein